MVSTVIFLSSLTHDINDTVWVDQFRLDKVCLIYATDSSTRFSAASIVFRVSLSAPVLGFKSIQLAQFWTPTYVTGDPAFNNAELVQILGTQHIVFIPIHAEATASIIFRANKASFSALFCITDQLSRITLRNVRRAGCLNLKLPVRFRQALSIWAYERIFQFIYATIVTSPVCDDIWKAHEELKGKQ